MKEIDRRGRTLIRLLMWIVWFIYHALVAIVFLVTPAEDDMTWTYAMFALVSTFFSWSVAYYGYYAVPRVYFSEEGVYIKRFIRKRFYPWRDIQEACILEKLERVRGRGGLRLYYQFYLLTSEGFSWIRGDSERRYRQRNRRYLLPIPLTDESREYVQKQGIQLVRDASKGEKIPMRPLYK